MDKKDILGKLGKIAAAAWLILFILAFSMDRSSRMGDMLILSAFAGVLPMIFFAMCDWNKEKPRICEKGHKMPKRISDVRYRAEGDSPDRVEVEFTDGSRCWYKR